MNDARPLTVGEWMFTLLVLAIPLLNLLAYFYWALADGVNLNRKRFCQASILWVLILIGVGVFGVVVMAALGGLAAMF
jgi:hypothetical protein